MPALAFKETEPMNGESSAEARDPREQLNTDDSVSAAEAVSIVPEQAKKLGATDKQARGLAEAMRLILLGNMDEAAVALQDSGHPSESVDAILRALRAGLLRDAA